MEVLSQHYPGIYFICEQCGALIGNVKQTEIYENNNVYCPLCKWLNKLPFNKNYEGIIKENKDGI